MNRIINLSMLVALFLLPGCGGTIIDTAKENFPQGKEYKNYQKKIKQYVKEVNIYDNFNTLGLFDALWLSDEMRTVYSDINADMRGKNTDVRHAFVRRQLKENKHYISFYVLSTHDNPLSVKPVPWAMHLEVDDKRYMPFEVKSIELAVEYKTMFGTLFNNHKTPYEVRFERTNSNGADILQEGHAHKMKLYFSSPEHFSSAQWNVDTLGNVSTVKHRAPSVDKQKIAPKKIKKHSSVLRNKKKKGKS
ncbi:MAG: hypothetical protein ACJAZS_000147 [Alteromonas naphthalenivorans]|jgi:hypothetical protein